MPDDIPEFTFNMYRRESGRWYVRVYSPELSTSRSQWQTNISLLTTDESAARQKLSKWERMYSRGEWDPRDGRPGKGKHVSVSDAVRRYLGRYRQHVQEATAERMRSCLERFAEVVGADTAVAQLDQDHVRAYLSSLRGRTSGSQPGSAKASTIRRNAALLRQFADDLIKNDLCDKRFTEGVQLPRKENGDTYEVLTPTDATRLLRAVLVDDGKRWFAQMVELALSSGMRIGEIRHLTWGDVDTDALQDVDPRAPDLNDVVTVEITDGPGDWHPKGGPRKRASYRQISVYPRGAAVLAVRYEGQAGTEPVFMQRGRPHHQDGVPVQATAAGYMREYGGKEHARFRPERQVTMHDLRHTWFTWLLNDLGLARKVPTISQMGGHANIERTWSYVTASEDGGREVVRQSMGLDEEDTRRGAVLDFLTSAPVFVQAKEQSVKSV